MGTDAEMVSTRWDKPTYNKDQKWDRTNLEGFNPLEKDLFLVMFFRYYVHNNMFYHLYGGTKEKNMEGVVESSDQPI